MNSVTHAHSGNVRSHAHPGNRRRTRDSNRVQHRSAFTHRHVSFDFTPAAKHAQTNVAAGRRLAYVTRQFARALEPLAVPLDDNVVLLESRPGSAASRGDPFNQRAAF